MTNYWQCGFLTEYADGLVSAVPGTCMEEIFEEDTSPPGMVKYVDGSIMCGWLATVKSDDFGTILRSYDSEDDETYFSAPPRSNHRLNCTSNAGVYIGNPVSLPSPASSATANQTVDLENDEDQYPAGTGILGHGTAGLRHW